MKIKKYTVLAACLLVFGTFNVSYADYMMGSHGNDVRILQRRLALYGLNVKANGTYDKATYKAVVKFQKKRHLTADGIIGPATYKALTGYENGFKNRLRCSRCRKEKQQCPNPEYGNQ